MKKILVIDDAQDIQFLLATLLDANGYQVDCTSNGQEALSLLRISSVLPDLILLDAQMPIMDGYEFRMQQRRDARLKEIPVVVMTADDDLTVRQEMLEPLVVLHKPLQIRSLIANVSHYLSKGISNDLKPSLA
jgi:CheY-like chemotaxis protein